MSGLEMIKGRVFKLGDNVDTDLIIPGRYLNDPDPEVMAAHCLEDAIENLPGRIQKGDILAAGKNFGCGSSREHAPVAIAAVGFSCVVAKDYARIFYRSSFNLGLPILEAPELADEVREGDVLSVSLDSGKIRNETTGKDYGFRPFPAFMRELLEAGGLIPYTLGKGGKGGRV
ncbi:MAG: 3-isopropylmalate dehydratase small subunit [Peptococcaceae bacterium]|jgi:3-isopropylmalate/(R)-2-methylmalate dehydratase small subunit|nr:3-isopropylmalate dehydratase small subunit [Peptococcaceae bacterium]